MKYASEYKANQHVLGMLSEEDIYKRCMHDIIEHTPIDELKKLFKTDRINPYLREDVLKLYDTTKDDVVTALIEQLRKEEVILYRVQIDIP